MSFFCDTNVLVFIYKYQFHSLIKLQIPVKNTYMIFRFLKY